jgi:hypothetical protein
MRVNMTLTSVITSHTSAISTRRDAECGFSTHMRVILTRMRVNMTHTSVITTRTSVTYTRRV